MTIEPPRYSTITSAYLKAELMKFAKAAHKDESLQFLNSTASNEVLYKTFIQEGALQQVDQPGAIMTKLNAMAKAKKWSDMTATLKEARGTAEKHTVEIIHNFMNTDHGKRVMIFWLMGLTAAQATQADPLLTLYYTGRTPEDKYAAFEALAKLSSKARTALTQAGTPPPATAPTETADRIAHNVAVDKATKEVTGAVAACKSYLESATNTIKTSGVPRDPLEVDRMFESGRARHDKVVESWSKAIRLDPQFATKHATLAADKKKCDDLWGTYSTELKASH